MFPNTVIATTIKKIEVGDITKRNVTYTNSFDVPNTENNARIFGYPIEEKSYSETPYKLLNAKLIQNGVSVVPNAKAYVNKVKDNKINVAVLEGIYDYFESIKDLTIADINPIANSGWEAADIDSARTNTSGIVSALIHWGAADNPLYAVNFFLPSFYYHTIISDILGHTGLSTSGSILTDARFTDLIIPYPGDTFLYPQDFIEPYNGRATNNGMAFGGVTSGSNYRIQLDTADYGASNFDLANDQYELDSTVPLTVTINAHCEVSGVALDDATFLRFRIIRLRSAVETVLASVTIFPGDGNEDLTFSGAANVGDIFYIVFTSDDPSSPGVTGTIDTAYLEIIISREINRDEVAWNQLWPDTKITEILKDFFTRFAIIPKLSFDTLVLKDLESIISDRANAVNWSSKLTKTLPEINFRPSSYAQENYFYPDESEDVMNKELGSGSLSIDSDIISLSKDIYTSVFGNSLLHISTNFDNYRVAKISVYDSTSTGISDFKMEPGIRVLTSKARTDESSITFNAAPRTDYRLGYFVDSAVAKDTGWEYFLGQFYSTFEYALQRNKLVIKYYFLTEQDIATYDPHKIIWDGEGYYLVNAIMNFIPNKITKVELLKVG